MQKQQRSPEVGDIVKLKSFDLGDKFWTIQDGNVEWDLETHKVAKNAKNYYVVTCIMEMPGGSQVYMRLPGDSVNSIQEDLLYFHRYYDILEGATEKSIEVLYGTKD